MTSVRNITSPKKDENRVKILKVDVVDKHRRLASTLAPPILRLDNLADATMLRPEFNHQH